MIRQVFGNGNDAESYTYAIFDPLSRNSLISLINTNGIAGHLRTVMHCQEDFWRNKLVVFRFADLRKIYGVKCRKKAKEPSIDELREMINAELPENINELVRDNIDTAIDDYIKDLLLLCIEYNVPWADVVSVLQRYDKTYCWAELGLAVFNNGVFGGQFPAKSPSCYGQYLSYAITQYSISAPVWVNKAAMNIFGQIIMQLNPDDLLRHDKSEKQRASAKASEDRARQVWAKLGILCSNIRLIWRESIKVNNGGWTDYCDDISQNYNINLAKIIRTILLKVRYLAKKESGESGPCLPDESEIIEYIFKPEHSLPPKVKDAVISLLGNTS